MNNPVLRSTPGCLLFLAALPVFGVTSIASIEPTQMQAKITVQTDQQGFCTYRSSRGSAFSVSIPDLVDNGNTDARTGSVVNGAKHIFILGTRKANDALAAAGTYWIGVTCGSDSEVSTVFPTKPIQWGNTAPDILPFNAGKFGNMDHPVIDWNGTAAASTFCDPASHSYCDPATGVEYWLASKPGWNQGNGLVNAGSAGTWFQTPIDVTGGKWSSAANATSNGASYTVGSGGPSDPLFIPLNGPTSAFAANGTTDDIIFSVYCGSGAVSGITLTLQLGTYINGSGSPRLIGSPITTAACPTTNPGFLGYYPNTGNPANLVAQATFKGWGANGIQANHVAPPSGTVSVAGSTVSLGGTPGPGSYFDLDWTAGQPIAINGSYAHLAGAPATSTQLTIQENLGSLTNVPYTGTELGLMITKSNNGSNVSVSVGFNGAGSSIPSQGVNGDGGVVNSASVLVSRSADGATCGIYTVGCSAGVLTPPLKGYIGGFGTNGGQLGAFLWIPYNSDGSPRGETRLLSILAKQGNSSRVVANGDSVTGMILSLHSTFFGDSTNGNVFYSEDQNNRRLWKLTYNEAYGGSCTGYQSYHPYPPSGDYNNNGATNATDDCFMWTVTTPLTGGHDIQTQVMGTAGNNGAYQSGLNYLNQSVGTAHPGFDLGWMVNSGGSPGIAISANGGLVSVGFSRIQNGLGLLATFADDGSGAGTMVLKSVRNTWGDSPNLRWASAHACPIVDMATYRFCVTDPLEDTGQQGYAVFSNRNQAQVVQFNQAGFGSTASWVNTSTTTMTSNADFYTCPGSLPAPYTSFSGTANCVQVRVNTPFCNWQPNSSYVFPDGKTENQEFPCTTPGFGVANAAYSKLQDIALGDWLFGGDTGSGREKFIVVTTPVYNSATDITFWVLRTADYLYLNPNWGGGDTTGGQGHSMANNACCTHNAGTWTLVAAPTPNATFSTVIDPSNSSNNWLPDNPLRFSAHNTVGAGSTAGTYSSLQAGCGAQSNYYCGSVNLSAAGTIGIRFVNSMIAGPSFAGISDPFLGLVQSYPNSSGNPGSNPISTYQDFRAINPASGFIQAEFNTAFGNAFTMTPVAGTANTFLVSGDCCAASPDYKRFGLQGYAGRFWMRDVSSPATFSGGAVDMAFWSVCRAFHANECVSGSAAGQYYMTVPHRDIQSPVKCSSGTFGLAIPCLSEFGPMAGQTVQFRVDRLDSAGLGYRKFGFAHSHLGNHYVFSNCRATPDGQFMFCPGYWLDGVRTEWLALRIGALPPIDNVNRTNFVPIPVTYQGVPSASNIRARFGYAENGGDLLQCTAYAQDCSTEIPSGSPNDPFSFTNEAVTRQACASGASCTIAIPSLPNRILYYVIDRLDTSGNILETGPMQAVAVP